MTNVPFVSAFDINVGRNNKIRRLESSRTTTTTRRRRRTIVRLPTLEISNPKRRRRIVVDWHLNAHYDHEKDSDNVASTIHCNNSPSSTTSTRRDVLSNFGAAASSILLTTSQSSAATMMDTTTSIINNGNNKQSYFQQFPTLFAPLYGRVECRPTIKRQLSSNVWVLEQNLELGPLQVPLRCTVIRLEDSNSNTLWVHAPLAPTEEFFELVESCGNSSNDNSRGSGSSCAVVGHVVAPTYALEHKIFIKDALQKRWPNAQLWTSPGQFTFPLRNVSETYIWGKPVSGVLFGGSSDDDNNNDNDIPWTNEIEYETLSIGTFNIAGGPISLYETAFYHKRSKTLIVTDAVTQIPITPPTLNNPENLLLISKRSTSEPFLPEDTPEARQIGWEKTALLVSYFFPEHEELDPNQFGVVTWTDGWHENFQALAGRLLVPPVVRTLLYPQNPKEIQRWVHRIVERWYDMEYIVPAHFEAPIRVASAKDFQRAFAFLDDPSTIDTFPPNDLERGLQPIADLLYHKKK